MGTKVRKKCCECGREIEITVRKSSYDFIYVQALSKGLSVCNQCDSRSKWRVVK